MAGPYGAAAIFLARQFGFGFRVKDTVLTVETTQVTALQNDPDRIAFLVLNIGSTAITLSPRTPVTSGSGIVLLDNASSFSVSVRDDGIIPAWNWFAVGDAAAGSLFLIEIIGDTKEDFGEAQP